MTDYTDAFLDLEDAGMQYIQDGDLAGLQTLFSKSNPDDVAEFASAAIVGAARAGNVEILDWLVSKYSAALKECGDEALDAAFEGDHTEAIVWLNERGFVDDEEVDEE